MTGKDDGSGGAGTGAAGLPEDASEDAATRQARLEAENLRLRQLLEQASQEARRDRSALLDVEMRHSLLLRSATGFAILATDPDGLVTAWNAGAERLLGWRAEEALGRPAAMIFTEEQRAKGAPEDEMRLARADGRAEDERWHLRKDGSRFWGSGLLMPMRREGELLGYLKILRDRTARREAEQRLQAANTHLREVLEGIGEAFCALDRDWRFRHVSRKALDYWGLTREQVEGRPFLEALPEAENGEPWRACRRVMESRRAEHLEVWSPVLKRWIELDITPSSGGISLAFRDITGRRQAERARAESERRLRSLLEGIPQLVWCACGAGEWTWCSPQWSAYTGLSEQDSLGMGWLAAVHPEDRPAVEAAWAAAPEQGSLEVECRLCRGCDRQYRYFQTRAAPVRDQDGRIAEWFGTSTDVDELRGLQERQRLLAAELQHRVRNILAVVRSLSRRTAESSVTVEDLTAHLDGRIDALARTQAIVTRDPGSGVDLEELVAEELLAHAAQQERQIRIAGPPLRLQAKAAEIFGLAVHELGTNAVKYGALSVAAGRIDVGWRIDARAAGPWLVFRWRESGMPAPGIAAPSRTGFGTELLQRTLRYELGGGTTFAFRPGGLDCTIELPATERLLVRRGRHPPAPERTRRDR